MLFFMLSFIPMQEKAFAASSCPGISPLTDPLAIKMENGQTLIWDKVNPNLLSAKVKYEQLLKAKGWKITYNSAYRPYQYQKHFYEIVNAPASTCKNAEIRKHGLTGVVAVPNPNAPHVKGIAFDATVYDKNGKALNGKNFVSSSLVAVATQVGLSFTVPSSDGVHHELVNKPSAITETAMNAKGKITTASGFNVRNLPNATATRIGGVYTNDIVQIVAISGDWYKIKFGNDYGYIMAVKSGLALINVPIITEQPFIARGKVTTPSGVNVRSSYSVNAARLGGLNNGAYVDIVAKYGDWFKIKFGSGYGWIMGGNGYVQITTPPPPAQNKLIVNYYVVLYSQPDSKSKNYGSIAPQTVTVLKNSGNGWYQISSWAEPVWIFINPKPVRELQVDKKVTLYNQPLTTSTSYGQISSQKVTVLVDRGDDWYQITTYLGPKWIYFEKSPPIPGNSGSSVYPYKTLTLGIGNAEVHWLQFLLVYNGYHIGDHRFSDGFYMKDYCDGGYGQNTLNGLNQFKKQNGLAVVSNGIVDATVWKSLEKKIRQDYPDNDFINTLHFTLIREGSYSNLSSDPGGATYFGIAKNMNNWPGDIRTITPQAIVSVYRNKYWNAINCNKMSSSAMKLVLFDSYVLYGAGGGNSRGIVKWMQQLLGITADGGWGQNTWAAFNTKHADNKTFALQLAQKRTDSDNAFPNSVSKTGWLNRDSDLTAFLKNLPN
jgi:hypothetical protein